MKFGLHACCPLEGCPGKGRSRHYPKYSAIPQAALGRHRGVATHYLKSWLSGGCWQIPQVLVPYPLIDVAAGTATDWTHLVVVLIGLVVFEVFVREQDG